MLKLNGRPVHITVFPDNTSQVWKLDDSGLKPGSRATVSWEFSHEGEFLQLAQLKDLLDHYHVKSTLFLKYLPYGRQDKPVGNDKTFALVSFSKLLNTLNFESITICDPHSQVALNLIVNSTAQYVEDKIRDAIYALEAEVICYPDAGANYKYSHELRLHLLSVYGEKVRDQLTGNITNYKLILDDTNIKDKNILIVDDICDGGGTFKILAKDLLANGAKSVSLFVTHGIFSKGTNILFESGIKRVFTQDGEVGPRSGSQQF